MDSAQGQNAKTAIEKVTISALIEQQSKGLDDLHRTISELEDRIGLVLSAPDRPGDPASGERATPRGLLDVLMMHNGNLNVATTRIRQLMLRVQL